MKKKAFFALALACVTCSEATMHAYGPDKKNDLEAKIKRYFELVEADRDYHAWIVKVGKRGFPTYQRMLAQKPRNPGIIDAVYGVLAEIPGSRGQFLQGAIDHLTDESHVIRSGALRFIGKDLTPDEMPLVVSMLYDRNLQVVYDAMEIMGEKGTSLERTVLKVWLKNSPEAKHELARKRVQKAIDKINGRIRR